MMILQPGVFLQDRYEILEKIGSGGMSDVYKAKCHKLNRFVGIKVLKEEFSQDANFVAKFKMEAQAAAGLSHPNIVNIYDVIDEGDLHYIVMELIEGITLKNYIAKKGTLEVRETIGIAIQVAQGIAAAHEQHIIHRDIKPQNMIISKDGKVKVADFGIARAVSAQTMSAQAMGSVHYISPEQARGNYSDERSDIYSLGITMYEMVTGRVPFEGDNTVAVALAHLEEPITPPSVYNRDITLSLEKIILKCTDKKPERRYDSAAKLISDLRRSLVDPDTDFVEPASVREELGRTVTFTPEEMEQIKNGKKNTIDYYQPRHQDTAHNRVYQDSYNMREEPRAIRDDYPKRQSKKKHKPEPDVNPQIEKILTAAGVVVAIIIVAVLVMVFAKLGGVFNLGSGQKKQTEAQTSSAEEASTLSDTESYVPNVVNLPEELAESKLKDSSFVMKRTALQQYSEEIPEGSVISQDPKAGEAAAKYSSVTVVISKGSEKIDLTKLALKEMTGDEAKALLEENRFVVEMREENSDTAEKGKVSRFTPAAAKEGETVTLYVSLGSLADMVEVPKLVDQEEEIAIGMMADLNLVPGTATTASSDTVPKGTVISQDPAPGTSVEKGSAVSYVVSSGPEVSDQRYVAAINESYDLSSLIGPGAASAKVEVMIRLRQQVNGEEVVKTLMPAKEVSGINTLPISFSAIEGAPGVDTGNVEVVDVGTGAVLKSYPVTFFPQG